MHIALRAEGHGHSEDGHLSSSWEIAVVVSLLALLALILGTVIWHTRRTRRRRWRARLIDAEAGGETRQTPPPPDISYPLPSKPPPVSTK
ncbi:hypothetical protein DFH08DRAFT_955283 [Mycena albidolilacea]|uniref:Uncharacterized protein n=1 Tax=Mycena albidolilacea TaxID=1033008 RepID=A0AAD7ADQ0_9AGAR|nr:hypothetical protein DFH08DRAFT_955283 [Mycena albidolilacea]